VVIRIGACTLVLKNALHQWSDCAGCYLPRSRAVAALARPLCHLFTNCGDGAVPAAVQRAAALLTDRHPDTVDAIVASHPVVSDTDCSLRTKLAQLPLKLHAPALRAHAVHSRLCAPLTSVFAAALPLLTSLQHLHLTCSGQQAHLPIAGALAQLTALRGLRIDCVKPPATAAVVRAVAPASKLHAPALRAHAVHSRLCAPLTSVIAAALPPLTSLQHLHLTYSGQQAHLPIAGALAQLTALRGLRIDCVKPPATAAVVRAMAPASMLTRLHLAAPEVPYQQRLSMYADEQQMNEAFERHAAALSAAVQPSTQLQALTLHRLPVSAGGYTAVRDAFTRLTHLDFTDCGFVCDPETWLMPCTHLAGCAADEDAAEHHGLLAFGWRNAEAALAECSAVP
jgi:hypothetical protein